jgi:tetratricopeptide (TPR) repeat protein
MAYRGSVVRILAVLLIGLGLSSVHGAQSDDFETIFRAGSDAMRKGELTAAADAFTRCTALSPRFAEAWLNLGLARFQQGQLDLAVQALEKSRSLKPSLRGANLFLGIAQHRLDNQAAAVAALQRETVLSPDNPDAFMWLGIVQLAMGKAAEAIPALDKASQLSPNNIDILFHRGRAYMLVSKSIYERMYQVNPMSWRVHQVLAQSFDEAGRLDDAAAECQKAIELKPDEPGLHGQLADIHWKANHLDLAEAEFQNELKIAPNSVPAMYKLAVVSIERSKPEIAAGLLSKVVQKSPDSIESHYQLGRAQAQLQLFDSAIQNFSVVVAAAQNADPEILRQSYYQLAQLYRRTQRLPESRAALDTFVRLKQKADALQSQKLEDKLKLSVQENTHDVPK